jgi:hypothetical protein
VSGKRWLLVLAILGALLLGAAGILLLVTLPRYVDGKVLAAAEAQGVTLKPDEIDFGWGFVRLTQVQVSLERVRSVAMQVGRIDVVLSGLTPLSIELSNVDSLITGSLSNVGLELCDWTQAHPSAYSLPLSMKNVHARFVEPTGDPPWLELSAGELTQSATGGLFAAQHTRFLGLDLGKVLAGFARETSNIALGFGEADLSHAPLRVVVSTGKAPGARFTLAPVSADQLAKPLGIPFSLPGVIVSSQTEIAFGTGAAAGSINGTTSVTLKGYIPPHPFELDGFIFGDTTTFDSQFALPATRGRITLTNTRLTAGRFQLHGDGLLVRGSDHSEITVNLQGELPCSALAAVEAESRLSKLLGAALGAKAGKLAEQWVGGSVAVGLKVSADTRHPLAAHIDRTIGVGCGLHPLTLAELARLTPGAADIAELLGNLPGLATDLARLPSSLPALPSGLPPLPAGLATLPSGLPALPSGMPALLGLPPGLAPVTPATARPSSKAAPGSSSKKASPQPAASSGRN